MARKRITEKTLTQKPPAKGRLEIWDSVVTGLCLRITDRGVRSWSVMFRVDGQQHRVTIGAYPAVGVIEARQRARDILIDPKAAVKPKPVQSDDKPASGTVGAIMALWMKRHQEAKGRRSRFANEAILKNALADWLDRPLADLRRKHVQEIVDEIADRTPGMARRFVAHGHCMAQWALKREYIEVNPFAAIDVPAASERDRVLDNDEIRKIWRAAELIGWPYGHIVKLLFLTACRVDEIAHLAWSEIRREAREIHLPAERVKTKIELQLPLSDLALAIVDQLPVVGDSGLVFPAPRSDKPLRIEQRTKERLDKLAGVTDWQLRDIRRTCRTLMSRAGVRREIGERVLGHVVGSKVERTYDQHNYLPEMRVAASALTREVDRILTGETAKVVGLR